MGFGSRREFALLHSRGIGILVVRSGTNEAGLDSGSARGAHHILAWGASAFLYRTLDCNHIDVRQPALLLITEWGIWGSSENWHLHYTLR